MNEFQRKEELEDQLFAAVYAGDMVNAQSTLELIEQTAGETLSRRLVRAKRKAVPDRYPSVVGVESFPLPMPGAMPGESLRATLKRMSENG